MTSSSSGLPNPSQYEWDFELRNGVGIWFMKGWRGFADEDLEAASDHYRGRGSRDDIDATLAVFGDETSLPKETQEYMGEAWSENGAYTGVDGSGSSRTESPRWRSNRRCRFPTPKWRVSATSRRHSRGQATGNCHPSSTRPPFERRVDRPSIRGVGVGFRW
ncbi:hypothetical protein [Salinadaptatus halalkaliphilus]|uniref:hypothetical protein n=1 Tax=Salinadaptatus halalkaliphilus TaxID=2419781 RepID=UPI001FE859B3|nr:hypothetical protein [Salinadaptatus halalkaliphilus]